MFGILTLLGHCHTYAYFFAVTTQVVTCFTICVIFGGNFFPDKTKLKTKNKSNKVSFLPKDSISAIGYSKNKGENNANT